MNCDIHLTGELRKEVNTLAGEKSTEKLIAAAQAQIRIIKANIQADTDLLNAAKAEILKSWLKNEKQGKKAKKQPVEKVDKKAEQVGDVVFGKQTTYQGNQETVSTKNHGDAESEISIVRRKGEKTFRLMTPNKRELARDIASMKEAKELAKKIHDKVQVVDGRPFAVSKNGDVVLLRPAWGAATGGTASQLEEQAKAKLQTETKPAPQNNLEQIFASLDKHAKTEASQIDHPQAELIANIQNHWTDILQEHGFYTKNGKMYDMAGNQIDAPKAVEINKSKGCL